MRADEIISELKSRSDEKYRQNVMKLGIPAENSIGVPTGEIRKLAKQYGRSHALAWELWETGYHEARLLAVLMMDRKQTTLPDAEAMMAEVCSWDLCDYLCKNLILLLPGYPQLIRKWCDSERTYLKRAAFTLIASAMIHDKTIDTQAVERYLGLVRAYADDDREHVKKAVSCALREIGKHDFGCQEQAILLAHELIEAGGKGRVWVGRDALRELETLVQAEGRARLITSRSQMGQEESQ